MFLGHVCGDKPQAPVSIGTGASEYLVVVVVELSGLVVVDVVNVQEVVLELGAQVDVLGPGVVPPHAPARKQVLIEGPHGLDT